MVNEAASTHWKAERISCTKYMQEPLFSTLDYSFFWNQLPLCLPFMQLLTWDPFGFPERVCHFLTVKTLSVWEGGKYAEKAPALVFTVCTKDFTLLQNTTSHY